ncbi:MAG: autotransporter-associated beta strand repeat-containing protein [Tepidisphaeraceae bacterium]|jgi:autotransporter-associated beta strand protein
MRRSSGLLLAAAAAALWPIRSAQATPDTWTSTAGGNWTTIGDWSSHAAPTAGQDVYITSSFAGMQTITFNSTLGLTYNTLTVDTSGGGTNTFSMPANNLNVSDYEVIGNNGVGTFNQTGGSNTIPSTATLGFYLGNDASGSGTYALSTGASLSSPIEYIGAAGSGTFNQNGGSNTVSVLLSLSYFSGSTGAYNLANGTLSAGDESIGDGGVGTFNQTGGTNMVTQGLNVGTNSGSTGIYALATGAVLNSPVEYVGNAGNGTFDQNGGSNITQSLILGQESGSNGNYTLANGATLSVTIGEDIGLQGSGTFIQSGGTNTVAAQLQIAAVSGSTGSYTLNGGSLSAPVISVASIEDGASGSGTLTVSGGTLTTSSLYLGQSGGIGTGTLNISGNGVVQIGNSLNLNNGTVNQTGGTNTVSGVGEDQGLALGVEAGSTGSYILAAGATLNAAQEVIGGILIGSPSTLGGNGTFTQTGGTNTVSEEVIVGYSSGSIGNYTISGGTLNTPYVILGVGSGFTGIGTLAISGIGVVNISEGLAGAANSTLVLSGGLLNVENNGIASAANPISTVRLPAPGQTAGIQSLGGAGINGAGLNMNGGGTLLLIGTNNFYSGGTTIASGSTIQVGGFGGIYSTYGSIPATGNIDDEGSLQFSQSNNITLSGVISGAGAVLEAGSGTTTLSGINTYSGQTNVFLGTLAVNGEIYHGVGSAPNVNVSGGTLAGTGTIHSGITLNYGTIAPGPAGSTLSADRGLTASGGTLQFDVGTTTASELTLGGTASFSGGVDFAFTLSGTPAADSVFTILTSTGLSGAGSLDLTPTVIGRDTLTPSISGNNLIVTTTGGPANLSWIGNSNVSFDGGGAWDTQTTHNWENHSNESLTPDVFYTGDNVTFDDTASNFIVDLNSGIVTAGSVTFNNSLNAYTVNGYSAISGPGGVTFSGSKTVTLNNNNYYTGITTINGGGLVSLNGENDSPTFNVTSGTLQLAADYVLGAIPVVNLGNGTTTGVLDLDGTNTNAIGGLTGGPGNIVTNTSPNPATLVFTGSSSNFGGTIQDDGPVSLDVAGGSLTLSNTNTYSGATTISGGGTIVLGVDNALPVNSQLLLGIGDGTNATLDLNGHQQTIDSNLVANTTGTALVTNNNSSAVGTLNVNASINYSGTLADGAGKLAVKFTSGSSTLSGTANAYSGGTTIASIASLTASASGALPTGGAVVNNGSLQVIGATSNTIGNLSGSGALTVGDGANAATLQLASGSGGSAQGSLTINTGSTLDITNNHLFIDYGSGPDPITNIAGYIASGYNYGNWNGPGIISTTAQTPTNGLLYSVGYADGIDHVVAGLTSGQIEVKYTLLGDANLDGLVNGSDFNILAANFNQSITGWDQGDFNYDGLVNASDFNELAANFNQGVSSADVSAGDVAALDAFAAANGLSMPTSNVPEPASAGMMVMAGLGILQRRRRLSRLPDPR